MEFHLSFKDMSINPAEVIRENTDTEAVVHAPELFENDHLLDLCSVDEVYRRQSINYMKQVIKVALNISKIFGNKEPVKIITNVGGHSDSRFLDQLQVSTRIQKLSQSLIRTEGRKL